MSETEILTRNREACEQILREYHEEDAIDCEILQSGKLNITPFIVTGALVWAYRRIEALQTALAQAISQGCTCDHLYGSTCNIHRLGTPTGIQEAVDHLKALEEAACFVKQYLLELETSDTNSFSGQMWEIFHKPLHAKLDAALKGVRNV